MTRSEIIANAKEYCAEKKITAGWPQDAHVKFVARMIIGNLGIERAEDKIELLSILGLTCNPSAFRQVLESEKVLVKGETRSRESAEVIAARQLVELEV